MKKLLIALLLPFIIGFTACGDDKENPTSQDDEQNKTETENIQDVKATFQSIETDMDNMKKGLAAKSVEDLLGWDIDNSGSAPANEQWMNTVSEALNEALKNNTDGVGEGSKLQISQLGGVYTWDNSTKKFSVVASSDKFEIKMPSTPDKSTNNLVLSFSGYTDEEVNVTLLDKGNIHLPVAGNLALKIDGNLVYGYNLENITYDNGIPVALKGTFTLAPMAYTIHIGREQNNTKAVIDMTTSMGGQDVFGIKGSLTVAHDDYESLESEDLKDVDLEVMVHDMKMVIASNLFEILKLDDPTEQEVNELIDGSIHFKGVKTADLVFSKTDETLYYEYKDGTKVDAEEYVEILVDGIKTVFSSLFETEEDQAVTEVKSR